MMELKTQFIQAITEEMGRLNGEKFERLCTYFMSMVTETECIQVGHNLYKKPVGYTDDIIKDAHTVGQCGTEDGYFKSDKAIDDIDGCIKNSPKCHTIYLFANKRATGSEFNALFEKVSISYSRYHIELYDAYRMANKIYEKHYNTRNVIEILNYLPKANVYYKMMPVSNMLPVLPSGYVSRKEEDAIVEFLKSTDILQVYGLSGIGKSLLVQAVALKEAKNYDTVLWFNGKEIMQSNFSDAYLVSIGEKINLKFVLENFKVLLVVDNLNKDVSALKKMFVEANKKASKCILTSLSRSMGKDSSIEITYLDENTSREILNSALTPPNEKQACTLLGQINGYPLLIDITKRVVENGDYTWDELIELTDKSQLPDLDRNEEFASRIIGKYVLDNIELFNLLAYFDSTHLSYEFFKSLDIVKLKNLVRCSIIQQTGDYTCHIHSIVLQAIKRVLNGDKDDAKAKNKIQEFLASHIEGRDAGLYTFTSIYYNELMHIQSTLGVDDLLRHLIVLAIIYTCDTLSDYDKYLSLINNLVLDHNKTTIDLSLIIERFEMRQRHHSGLSHNDKGSRNKQTLSDVEELKSILNGNANHDSLIYHHIGKWFFTIEEYDECETWLRKAMEYNPASYSSLLTLARLYNKKKDKEKFAGVFSQIFNEKILPSVPLSVQLSMYGLLNAGINSDLRKKYIDEHLDRFASTIYASLSERYSQTYHELSKLAGSLAYKHPEFYNRLCYGLPMPLEIDTNDQLRKNYGAILSAQYRYGKNSTEENCLILHRAELYLTGISFRNDLERKLLFDLYVASNQSDKAIDFAATYENQADIYMHQGLCKAYRQKKDFDKSLEMIQFSIGHENGAYIGYKAAFRHDKALTLYAMGEEKAREIMKEAIDIQPDNKIKDDWESELKTWEDSI